MPKIQLASVFARNAFCHQFSFLCVAAVCTSVFIFSSLHIFNISIKCILKIGSEKADKVAQKVLSRVREKLGYN